MTRKKLKILRARSLPSLVNLLIHQCGKSIHCRNSLGRGASVVHGVQPWSQNMLLAQDLDRTQAGPTLDSQTGMEIRAPKGTQTRMASLLGKSKNWTYVESSCFIFPHDLKFLRQKQKQAKKKRLLSAPP